MAKINLLPWREERRARLKQEFFAVLGMAAFLGVAVVYLYDMAVQSSIATQIRGSQYIKEQTQKLDDEIAEIENIKQKRENLIDRMEVIQNLQGNRSVIVHQFDELVRVVPDGVYFTSINKTGSTFKIQGVADANNRVSNLMRNLEKSDWFKNASLSRVSAEEGSEEQSNSNFQLSVQEDSPKHEAEG